MAEAMASYPFLAEVAMWTGSVVGVLTIVDWSLSKQQKMRISDWGKRAYEWLKQQRAISYVQAIRKPKPQALIVLFTIIMMVAYAGFSELDRTRPWDLLDMLGAAILAWVTGIFYWLTLKIVHPLVLGWVGCNGSTARFMNRLLMASVGCFAMASLLIIASVTMETPGPDQSPAAAKILLFIALPFVIECIIIIGLLAVSLLWVIILSLIQGLVYILAFVVLRTIEHEKGPVLGLSGLLVGIGAIAKALLG